MKLGNIGKVTKDKLKPSGIGAFLEIELSKITPNPNQPRKDFKNIDELANSIKLHGLLASQSQW